MLDIILEPTCLQSSHFKIKFGTHLLNPSACYSYPCHLPYIDQHNNIR